MVDDPIEELISKIDRIRIDKIKSSGYSEDFVRGFQAGLEIAFELIRRVNEVEEQDEDNGGNDE